MSHSGDSTWTPPGAGCHRNEFSDLISAYQAGSEDAARELYTKYHRAVLVVIRHHFLPPGHVLRGKLESVDILEQAFEAGLQRLKDGQSFTSDADFLRFITSLARNIFRKECRAHVNTRKRSILTEETFDSAKHDVAVGGADPVVDLGAREEWLHMLSSMKPRTRGILLALRAGETIAEVAERLVLSVRTIERAVECGRQFLAARDSARWSGHASSTKQ
jgi:RNA polymerase sigma factor (sigma-70 family)